MCTGINFSSLEKNQYLGRTQEYNINFDYIGVQIPRNLNIKESITEWKTLYSVIGVGIRESNGQAAQTVIDGVNEHGLGGITQYFSEFNCYAPLEDIEKNNKFPVLAEQLVFWVLANCKDTKEVEHKLNHIAIPNISIDGSQNGLPQHFMFSDKTGRTIVVEPSRYLGFDIYENTIGVMTNSPKFDWHLSNLENYTSLSDKPVPHKEFHNKIIQSNKSSGLRGLPGDYSPASRFVRASYLLMFSDPVSDEMAINKLFHLLSTSDIVKGVEKLEGTEDINRQYTQYTSAYDLNKVQLFIKLYENLEIQTLEFDVSIINEKEIQIYTFNKTQQYKKLQISDKL
ncbi:linear amide C-N hydrolase [Vagococcus fluvialis]|uniref:linear amide C-N hydrolase n=1 Tax=Vagococcus fluvialis TaxID=2738 RepID=UPI00379BAD9A